MFVKAHNTTLLVRQTGEIWNENLETVVPRQDAVGDMVVDYRGETIKVKELVIAHHGEPPHKCRFPKDGEEVECIDGDKTNVSIENLRYVSKSKEGKTPSDLTPEHHARILELIEAGTPYDVILADYAEKGVRLHKPQLTEMKKKALELKEADEAKAAELKAKADAAIAEKDPSPEKPEPEPAKKPAKKKTKKKAKASK